MLKRYRPAIYTFAAVLAAVGGVCAIALPSLLGFAQRTYYELQKDVTERQARSMERFLQSRLAQGVDQNQVIAEFQAVVAGSDTDRGYVCLIDQRESRYLGHPDLEALGMTVKPGSMFERNFLGEGIAWPALISQGASGGGLLDINRGMMQEIIHFMPVPGAEWTVSAHENTQRIDAEIQRLRRVLGLGGLSFGLLLAAAASLAARQVGRRNERQLERAHRLERQVLEAENSRKADELESARQLQLSMLPSVLPKPPKLELAAEMHTATEVGGDYYDFAMADDGTLTAIVADVTGHGIEAGTMVATLKGLFIHCAGEPTLEALLGQMADTLQRVGLPRLLVAVGLARLRGLELELVGAGLPPALVYRASGRKLERVELDGIPLGGSIRSWAAVKRTRLSPGDAVVLMSDGLPELLNPEEEVLGYDRVAQAVAELGAGSAEEIVGGLRQLAQDWARGRGNDDDITISVIRAQQDATGAM